MFVSERRKKILGEPRYGFANIEFGFMSWSEDCDHTEPPEGSLEFTEDCDHTEPPEGSLEFTEDCES